MEFLSLLALILLTLAGYSSGNVLAAPGRRAWPDLVDLPITFALWAIALDVRQQFERGVGILFGLGLGVMVGLLVGILRRHRFTLQKTAAVSGFRAQWWDFNARLGEFQSRLFLTWFYFLLVTPFGIITRLSGDRLRLRRPHSASMWLKRTEVERPDEARARKQF